MKKNRDDRTSLHHWYYAQKKTVIIPKRCTCHIIRKNKVHIDQRSTQLNCRLLSWITKNNNHKKIKIRIEIEFQINDKMIQYFLNSKFLTFKSFSTINEFNQFFKNTDSSFCAIFNFNFIIFIFSLWFYLPNVWEQ